MSIRPSHHNFAGNTQNTSVARMNKMRERFNRWEHKANERKSMFIERQKARVERYRNAFRGSWITKIGLGLVALWSFITKPPFVVLIEKRATVPFTAMLPFGVKFGKKGKSTRRTSTTRNRLSPETLEQRQLLAGDLLYVDNPSDFVASNPTADTVVTWGGADGVVGTGGDDVAGLTFEPTAPVTVDNTAYDTIQEAIDAAASGDVINLAPGEYVENLTIPVGKDGLIIRGARVGIAGDDPSRDLTGGIGESTISGSIQVSSVNVTIDGVRVLDGATVLGQNVGIYVEAEDAIITNSVLYRTGAFDLYRGVLTPLPAGAGDGLTVSNSVFEGWATGVYNNGANDVSVSGNTFQGNNVGVSGDAYAGGNSNYDVTNNTFVNNVVEGMGLFGDAGFAWDTDSSVTGNTFVGPGIFLYGEEPAAGVINGNSIEVATTLQAAIDAAFPGDEIVLAADSSFIEDVVIDVAGLTITGPFADVAGTGLARDLETGVGEATIEGSVRVSASGVTLNGVRVLNGAALLGQNVGVYVEATDLTVENSVFYRTPTPDGYRAILTVLPAGSSDGLSVADNAFEGWATGVFVQGANNASVTGNLFEANNVGVSADSYAGGNSNLDITGNSFVDNAIEGFGIGEVGVAWDATSDFTGNTFVGPGIFSYSPTLPLSVLGWGTTAEIAGTVGDDQFSVEPSASAGFVSVLLDGSPIAQVPSGVSLALNGGDGIDTFTIDAQAIPTGGLSINGETPTTGTGDSLVLTNSGADPAAITHAFTSGSEGSVDIDGAVITYTGLEPIVDNLPAATRTFDYSAANADAITLAASSVSGSTHTINSAFAEVVDFVLPTTTLNIIGDVDDALSISTDVSVPNIALNVPTVTLDAELTGTVSGTASLVNVTNNAEVQDGIDVAGAGGTVSIAAGTYSLTSTISVTKDVTIKGATGTADDVVLQGTIGIDDVINVVNTGISSLTISDLTVENAGTRHGIRAAGIVAPMTLTIDNVISQDNARWGVAVSGSVTLAVTDSVFSGNTADGGVGTFSGVVAATISGSDFSGQTTGTQINNNTGTGMTINASGSFFGTTSPASVTTNGNVDYTPMLNAAPTGTSADFDNLIVHASGQQVGGGRITEGQALLNASGTLQVRGGTYGEDVIVDDYTYSPGASPAINTVGSYTQTSGGTTLLELDGTAAGAEYDQIKVDAAAAGTGTGAVSLDGALSLVFGYVPVPGDSWTLIDNDGSDAVTGAFATPNGTTFFGTIPGGGQVPLTIDYAGGDGNDVVLSVTTFNTLYAAAGVPADVFTLDQDNDSSGTVTTGDEVTFTAPGGTPVSGLTFGFQAFADIQDAIDAAPASATINVAGYSTNEDGVAVTGTVTQAPYITISSIGTTAGFDGSVTATGSSFTFTPDDADEFGPETFNLTLSDNGTPTANTISAIVTIDVLPVNDEPTFAISSPVTVGEDSGAFSGSVATSIDLGPANEVPPQAATFTLTQSSGATGLFSAAPAIDVSGNLTFTTASNANGTAVFDVVLNDGGGTANGGDDISPTLQLTIEVTAVNDIPTAGNDSYSAMEDTALTVSAPGVLSNDSDVDGDSLTAIKVTNPANGSVVLNADGSFTYTPNNNYFGTDSFTYKVNDGTVDSANAVVTINVASDNDAPTAVDDTVSVVEDTATTINVRSNDTDVEDGTPSGAIALVTGPTNGTVSISGGDFVYTPDAEYNGSDSFTYTVQDSDGATSNTATVDITVTPVDDPVVANDDNPAAVNEDNPVTGNVLTNDVNVDPGDTLSASINTGPANGTVTLATNGAFTYTPDPDFNGNDSFTYDVTDGTTVDTATVNITINAVNDAPVNSVPITTLTTAEDTALVLTGATAISVSDVDADSGDLTVTLTATNGTLTVTGPTGSLTSATGSGGATVMLVGTPADLNAALDGLTFDPTSNYNGAASITVDTDDMGNTGADPGLTGTPSSEADSDVISITVSDVNDPPVALNDTVNVLEDGDLTVLVTNNDSDSDGAIASVTAGSPSNGTAVVSGLNVVYTPNDDYFGTDSFSYTITDDDGATATAMVTVNVRQLNDKPVAVDDSATLNEDDSSVTINVLSNDNAGPFATSTEENGQTLSIVGFGSVSGVLAGSFTFTASTITFTPPTNFSGTATLEYIIEDNGQDSDLSGNLTNNFKQDTGLLTVTVEPDSDIPTLTVSNASGNEDTAISLSISAALTDPSEVLSDVTITGVPAGASLSAGADAGGGTWTVPVGSLGGLTITPPTHDNADFTLGVAVSSTDAPDTAETATASISVSVNATNDAPQITVPVAQTMNEDASLTFTGATAISVVDVDAAEGTGDIQVTVTVPVVKGTLTLGSTPGTLTSVAGDGTSTVVLVGTPADITTALDGLQFDSATDENGAVTLNVNADDQGNSPGSAATASASVTIIVTPVPDTPVANIDSYSVSEDGTLTVSAGVGVLANDTDGDGDPLTVDGAPTTIPTSNGSVDLNADGSFTYTPNANYAGSDSFSYQATDGSNVSAVANVSITVNPVNDAPSAPNVSISAIENEVADFDLKTIASDLETPAASLTFAPNATTPSNGTLTLSPTNGMWQYTPDPGFTGIDTIGYDVTDTGQGVSGAITSSGVLTIVVSPFNDPPINTVPDLVANPAAATIDEDTSLTFISSTVTEISVNDPDVGGGNLEVMLSVGSGDLALASGSGVTVTAGADNSPTVTFTGTQAEINAALDGLVYTPNVHYNGTDTLTIVTDDLGNTGAPSNQVDTDAFTITIDPVADAPIARDDSYSASGAISVPAGTGVLNRVDAPGETVDDVDNDGDAIMVFSVEGASGDVGTTTTLASGATVTLNADGSFTYDPSGSADFIELAAGETGSDTFDYVITDGGLQSATATVTINLTGVNDAPIAVGDTATVAEDDSVTITVLTGDSDPDTVPSTVVPGNGQQINPATVNISSGPSNGTVMVNPSGTVTYTPNGDYSGPDSFSYTVKDDAGLESAPATVNITVTPMNDAPVGNVETYSTNEDIPLTIASPGVLANDTDVDGDPLTAVLVGATNGTVLLNSNGGFTFTPALNYNGPATFTYRAMDSSSALSAPTVVTINVANVNDAPVAVADGPIAVTEDTPITFGVIGNDTDADGNGTIDAATVTPGATTPNKGSVSINPTTGEITYTPNLNATGSDSFSYTVKDTSGAISNEATVTLNITGTPDEPVASDDAYSVSQGGTLNVAPTGVLGNDSDPDGDTLSAVLVGSAPLGLTLNPNGSFDYVVPASFDSLASGESDTVTFQYNANDGGLDSNVATVEITITGTNDQPVANAATFAATEDTVLSDTLTGSDTDTNDTLTYTLTSPASKGTVVVNTDGTFTYTPNAGENGPDLFKFKVTDDSGAANADSAVKNVIINIAAVNSDPTFDIVDVTVNEDSGPFSGTQPISNALPGPPDEVTAGQTVTFTMTQTGGTAGLFSAGPSLTTAGVLSFTPASNMSGSATFDVTATDDGVAVETTTKSLTITVDSVEDPTTASLLNLGNINEDVPVVITEAALIAQGFDPDSTIAFTSLSVDAGSTGAGTLAAGPNPGEYTFTPTAEYAGPVVLNFTVTGSNAVSSMVNFTYVAQNDAPKLTLPTTGLPTGTEGDVLSINGVSVADVDVGSGNLQLDITSTAGTVALATAPVLPGTVTPITDGIRITGTPANINAALSGGNFQFTVGDVDPGAAASATAAINFLLDDLGNTGAPGAKTDAGSLDLTVTDKAPSLTLSDSTSPVGEIDEATTYNLTIGGYADGGSDPITQVQIRWGDGSPNTVLTGGAIASLNTSGSITVPHAYIDDPAGSANGVNLQVDVVTQGNAQQFNNVGNFSPVRSPNLTVNNVAPTVSSALATSPLVVGQNGTFQIMANDVAGANDPLEYSVDWDNDSVFDYVGPLSTITIPGSAITTAGPGAQMINWQVDDGDGGVVTGTTNEDVLPVINFSVSDATVNEGDQDVIITVTLLNDIPVTSPSIPVEVVYSSLGATPGVDFTFDGPQTVMFAGGDTAGTTKEVKIDITQDSAVEGLEFWGMTLTSSYSPGLGDPILNLPAPTAVGTGVIVDDDNDFRVTEVKVGSVTGAGVTSGWSQSFMDLADGETLGSALGQGYSIPTGSTAQTQPLPWSTINRLYVSFTDDIDASSVVANSNVILHSTLAGPTISSINVVGKQMEINLTGPLATNSFRLEVQDTVLGISGVPLDGDFVNESTVLDSVSHSGGAAPVGDPANDFNFQFVVLPGDANQNGAVTTGDSSFVFGRFFTAAGMPNYSIFGDINGNGAITTGDTSIVFGNFFTMAPTSFPGTLASNMSYSSGESTVNDDENLTGDLQATSAGSAGVSVLMPETDVWDSDESDAVDEVMSEISADMLSESIVDDLL
ncbi:protein containing Planctomycete extracellular domain protein [Rhodopirellula baltica SH28]|uniref:Protein containing Planctomycete extracellular domain protein n=1 Tax=Rhodopirellula baltica SH28 TaxID=993517 RepID=K5DJT6_RHOBT|nr:Ig-like domain-containing protein [Rhodopirellula baltica]EKK02698.1 protein containing Planctomycete extracellular domain protein [Rhodopirellula baltica SH28]